MAARPPSKEQEKDKPKEIKTEEAADPLPPSIGSLERPGALVRFFAALAKLESKEADDDVRIVQFGDSHTAADWQTGPLRRSLQARFGDGGRGFLPMGRPWKAWSQEGVITNQAGDWTTQMNSPSSRRPTGDGVFGLSGVAMATRQGGARAWMDVLVNASSAELAYLEQPGGGSFDLVVDGRSVRISTRAEQRHAAFRTVEIAVGPEAKVQAHHHLEVRANGDGEVRLFGLALDRAEHGLVFDALGINGARIATPVSWVESSWAESLKHRAPALVIFAYGTNDAIDAETSDDTIEAGFTEMLGRLTRAAPNAACLVLGPADRANQVGAEWKSPARLTEIVARERRAAAAAKCAFFDQMAAMGGAGSMARWAAESYPRGQPDRVHFSRDGYSQLGSFFTTDLLRAYDTWRERKPPPPSR